MWVGGWVGGSGFRVLKEMEGATQGGLHGKACLLGRAGHGRSALLLLRAACARLTCL